MFCFFIFFLFILQLTSTIRHLKLVQDLKEFLKVLGKNTKLNTNLNFHMTSLNLNDSTELACIKFNLQSYTSKDEKLAN